MTIKEQIEEFLLYTVLYTPETNKVLVKGLLEIPAIKAIEDFNKSQIQRYIDNHKDTNHGEQKS